MAREALWSIVRLAGQAPSRLRPLSSNVRPQSTSFGATSLAKGCKVSRQIVFTPKAAKPPPTYSQAVKAAGLVFVSGTAPTDPATGAIIGTTIQEQTRQCLSNIQAILEAAGSSLDIRPSGLLSA